MPEDYTRRPKDFDPLVADAMIERIANGENLIAVVRSDPRLPLPATFLDWVEKDPTLAEAYERAQRMRTDILVEDMLEVGEGHDAHRSRVQVGVRQFHAERLMPQKYSPRAYVAVPKTSEDDRGGIDYGADVRRKLEQMANRLATEKTAAGAE